MISRLNSLNGIAERRGQTLSQPALSWVLHNPAVTTDEEVTKIEELLR